MWILKESCLYFDWWFKKCFISTHYLLQNLRFRIRFFTSSLIYDNVCSTICWHRSGTHSYDVAGLDYDLGRRSYRLTALVSDSLYNLLVDRQVLVKSVNQYPPVLPPSATVSVSENEATNYVLYTAIATDVDTVLKNLTSLSYFISTGQNWTYIINSGWWIQLRN